MNSETPVQDYREPAAVPPQETMRTPAGYAADERWAAAQRKGQPYIGDDPRRKSPALAMILSLMPGLGQIYIGYYQQGFTNILIVAGTIMLLVNSGRFGMGPLVPLLGLFLAFYWMFNLVDAGRRASFYNQALAGVDKAELPPDMNLPRGGGSLAGGVVLIILGLITFSNTMFGFSLEWVEKWWPLALIIGGAWLVYGAMRDRQQKAE